MVKIGQASSDDATTRATTTHNDIDLHLSVKGTIPSIQLPTSSGIVIVKVRRHWTIQEGDVSRCTQLQTQETDVN